MKFLAGRLFRKLVLNDSIHFTDSVENALCEFVLVVYCEPATEHLSNVGLEHLGARQFDEGLLLEHCEFLTLLGSFAELSCVR